MQTTVKKYCITVIKTFQSNQFKNILFFINIQGTSRQVCIYYPVNKKQKQTKMKTVLFIALLITATFAWKKSDITDKHAATAESIRTKILSENFDPSKFHPVYPTATGQSFRTNSHKRDLITPASVSEALNTDSCDYIVLGAGSAGGAIAGLLSENPENTVCLFERGQDESLRDPFVQVPGLNWVQAVIPDGSIGPTERVPSLEPFLGNFYDQLFVAWALGGGPGVSGSIWSCFENSTYNGLASLTGDATLNASYAVPLFRANENLLPNASSQIRGHSGPIEVQLLDKDDPNIRPFADLAAAAFGYSVIDDCCRNGAIDGVCTLGRSLKRSVTCGATSGNCQRQSSYTTFVEPYIGNRTNLRVYIGAQINKIKFSRLNHPTKNPKVDKVFFTLNGEGYKINTKNIVSSLGTYNDAKLLMLSGIGDASLLTANHIPVVRNLTGVGKNIQDSSNIPMYWYLPFLPALTPGAPLDAPTAVFTAYFASGLHGSNVDVEILFGILPSFLFASQLGPGAPGGVLLAFAIQLIDVNDGFMTPRSTNYDERFNYQNNFNPARMNATIWAMKKFRESMANISSTIAPFSFEVSPGVATLPIDADYETYRAFIKNNNKNQQFGWNHPHSSARMGPLSDPLTVVDSKQRVVGIDGLFIASNAITNPAFVPAGHPSSYATYWGRRLADLINSGAV